MILLPVIVIGAYLTTRLSISSMDPELLGNAVEQIGSRDLLIVISTIQPVFLAVFSAFFGYILSEKVGLMLPFRFEGRKLGITAIVSLIGGAVFSLDAWTFAKLIPEVAASYEGAGKFDAASWIASVLYGGVVEELMMRLLLMSFLAFLAWKLFFKKEESVPAGVFIGANIIAALSFAAGHLPATIQTFGSLTLPILIRCFLLNGSFGLVFGRLYRKYGIQYAMLAHMLFHIVSKIIWLTAL